MEKNKKSYYYIINEQQNTQNAENKTSYRIETMKKTKNKLFNLNLKSKIIYATVQTNNKYQLTLLNKLYSYVQINKFRDIKNNLSRAVFLLLFHFRKTKCVYYVFFYGSFFYACYKYTMIGPLPHSFSLSLTHLLCLIFSVFDSQNDCLISLIIFYFR